MKQGWIEGALDTCYSILSILPSLKNYKLVKYEYLCGTEGEVNNVEEDKVEEEKVEEEKEIKEEEEVKEIKKEEKEIQLYTIDEVLEQDEWIIIEVDGKKNIYDLSKWIQHHPGGDAIFQGIEANNHYKNKKLYPDSPTELFDGIHYHHEEGAFEKYFKNKNEYVELVGRLK